jgi:hypothetical protein
MSKTISNGVMEKKWEELEEAIIARETASTLRASAHKTFQEAEQRAREADAKVKSLRMEITGFRATAHLGNTEALELADKAGDSATPTVEKKKAPEGSPEERMKAILETVSHRTRKPLAEVLKFMAKQGEPVSRSDVAEGLKLFPKTAGQRLTRAVALGLVKHDGRNSYDLA